MNWLSYLPIGVLVLLCSGCFVDIEREENFPVRSRLPQEPLAQGIYYLDEHCPQKAVEVLTESVSKTSGSTTEIDYQLARAFALMGQVAEAQRYYHKVLEQNPQHPAAYHSLETLYQWRLTQLEKERDETRKTLATAPPDLERWHEKEQELLRQTVECHLARTEIYLLYENPEDNADHFSLLEANLRDFQDLLKEAAEARLAGSSTGQETIKLEEISWFPEVRQARSQLGYKNIAVHLILSEQSEKSGDLTRALEELKEADEQIDKFFGEDDQRDAGFLQRDAQLQEIYQKVYQRRQAIWQTSATLHRQHRQRFADLGRWQDVRNADASLEQELETAIHAHWEYLWRLRGVSKFDAEIHVEMIPDYENLLQSVQNPRKKGETHLRLTHGYLAQGQYDKAWQQVRLAEKELGSYKVNDLVARLKKLSPEPGEAGK